MKHTESANFSLYWSYLLLGVYGVTVHQRHWKPRKVCQKWSSTCKWCCCCRFQLLLLLLLTQHHRFWWFNVNSNAYHAYKCSHFFALVVAVTVSFSFFFLFIFANDDECGGINGLWLPYYIFLFHSRISRLHIKLRNSNSQRFRFVRFIFQHFFLSVIFNRIHIVIDLIFWIAFGLLLCFRVVSTATIFMH